MLVIKEFSDNDSYQWNKFVNNHNDSTFYHLYEWRKIYEESYRLKTYYLGFYLVDKLVGILPIVIINRPLSKPFAVSLPFSNYAGLLIEQPSSKEIIFESLIPFLKNKNIFGFENRHISVNEGNNSDEVTLKRKLPTSADILWKDLDAKVRNQIRKAQRAGLNLRFGIDQIDELYNIYSRNMLSLGTPVHSRLFFDCICRILKDYVDILTIRREGEAIAVMLLVKFKKQLSDPVASSLKKYLSLNPNMLLYWGALQYGCENGYEEFDFGRSNVNSGTYNFKIQWDAKQFNLSYDFYSLVGNERKSTIASYRGSRAKMFSNVWKRIPYFMSLWIGPKLRKYIP